MNVWKSKVMKCNSSENNITLVRLREEGSSQPGIWKARYRIGRLSGLLTFEMEDFCPLFCQRGERVGSVTRSMLYGTKS